MWRCGVRIAGEGVAVIVRALHFGVGGNTPVIRSSQTEQEILSTQVQVYVFHRSPAMGKAVTSGYNGSV